MTLASELPNDVETLKQLILEERRQRQAEAERFEAEKQAAIDEAVKAAVAAILRRYYGPRSESFDPRQLLLFGQRIESAALDLANIEQEAGEPLVSRRVKNRDKHGRQQLPEHLERIEIEHDLDDKACPACGNERCRIGAEISEQLEYFPASFKVLKHIRYKYACTKCDADAPIGLARQEDCKYSNGPLLAIEEGNPRVEVWSHFQAFKGADALVWETLSSLARTANAILQPQTSSLRRCVGHRADRPSMPRTPAPYADCCG